MEHKGRGDILFREGKLEEAAAQYTEALGKKEDYVDALAMRGLARKQQGHNEEAINDLSRAAELKHGDAFLSYNLGITYLERNDAKMAVSKFKEALNLIPHDVAALCGKGEAELCLGQFTNALVGGLLPRIGGCYVARALISLIHAPCSLSYPTFPSGYCATARKDQDAKLEL